MLHSIGHSNRTFIEFVDILQAHHIDVLIDVRGGKAQSRAFPHFNTENFAIEIPKIGLEYFRFEELGGRCSKMKDADPLLNDSWRVPAFKNYADKAYYSEIFQTRLDTLIQLGKEFEVAFMCSEAVPWRCHRGIISDYLILLHNQKVTHLLSTKQTMNGTARDHAMVYNNRVIYPKNRNIVNVCEFIDF